MTTRTLRIASIGAVVILALVLAGVALNRRDDGSILSNKSEQKAEATPPTTEQIKENDGGDKAVAPDVNTQEFKLTTSNVSCSTTNINGVESRSCSGNIGVVPRAQADMDPGVYKLNEQTKLIHNGAEEDLNNLQSLAQANAIIRIKLAPGSSDLLTEINY